MFNCEKTQYSELLHGIKLMKQKLLKTNKAIQYDMKIYSTFDAYSSERDHVMKQNKFF